MTHSTTESGLQRLHDAMAARVEKGELPGLVTLITRGDEVQVDAIGRFAFGSDMPMQRSTIFRIASLTKPILAAATMVLVEEGKLALDAPVEGLLPELANRKVLKRLDGPLDDTVPAARSITTEDLLTMRMGHGMLFDSGQLNPPYPINVAADELQLVMGPPDPRTPHTPDEWMKRFATLPLMFQPGERWVYNTGSLVLGVLVARAAGLPLGEVLKTRIFEPLGMSETGFWMPASEVSRMPSQYMTNFQTGTLELQTVSDPLVWTVPPPFPSGAGGLLGTIDDYLAFARMLLNKGVGNGKRVLSERSVELMTTNHLTSAQIATGGPLLGEVGWGFGMAVVTEPDDVSSTPGRYGWAGGYGTDWFNDPSQNLIAIVMTQTSDFLWNGGLVEFSKLAIQP